MSCLYWLLSLNRHMSCLTLATLKSNLNCPDNKCLSLWQTRACLANQSESESESIILMTKQVSFWQTSFLSNKRVFLYNKQMCQFLTSKRVNLKFFSNKRVFLTTSVRSDNNELIIFLTVKCPSDKQIPFGQQVHSLQTKE